MRESYSHAILMRYIAGGGLAAMLSVAVSIGACPKLDEYQTKANAKVEHQAMRETSDLRYHMAMDRVEKVAKQIETIQEQNTAVLGTLQRIESAVTGPR